MHTLIGVSRNCERRSLGVSRIYFIRASDVASLSFDSLDRISNIELVSGKAWKEIEVGAGEGLFTQSLRKSGAWPQSTQEVEVTQAGISSSILRAIRRLGDACDLHMIVTTLNDSSYYLGVNYYPERGYFWESQNLQFESGSTDAGTQSTGSGVSLRFASSGRNFAPVVVYDLAGLTVEPVPDGDPVVDITAPFVIQQFPQDDSSGVSVDPAFFQLIFNEFIQVANGALVVTLKETSGDATVDSWTLSSGVSVNQSLATLEVDTTGLSSLSYSTGYYLTITANSLSDLSGNLWPGYTAKTDWNFTTEAAPDTTALSLVSTSPVDDSTTVNHTTQTTLGLTFDNPPAAGFGNILLYLSDGSLVGSYDVNSSNVTFSGNDVSVAIGAVLLSDRSYYVRVTSSAIESASSGIAWAGISNSTDFNFSTVDVGAPEYSSFSPDVATTDNSYSIASISFTATEALQKNTGNIVIKDYDTDATLYTVAVGDSSVGISGATVTIDLSDMPGVDATAAEILPPYQRIYIEQATDTFQDLSGNALPALTKSGSDVWNFTTALPPLQVAIDPLVGSGAQTIAVEFGNTNAEGVMVIEWEPGDFRRYSISASPTDTEESNIFTSEINSLINVYFIGVSDVVAYDYGIDSFTIDNQSFVGGLAFDDAAQFGSFRVVDSEAVAYLSRLEDASFLDLLEVNGLPGWTGSTTSVDFNSGGGGVGTAAILSNNPGVSFVLDSVSGYPLANLTFSNNEDCDLDLSNVTWGSSTLALNINNNSFATDGVVINRALNSLWTSLNSSSAGGSGGTLNLAGHQIDYFTGTGAGIAWASMWNILNIPSSPTDWSLTFDDSSGPLSIVNTSDTAADQAFEASGIQCGVMIGNEGGVTSIHDYTASGTSRVTLSQTGMNGTAKNVWMAVYFADGFDMSSEISASVPSTHGSSTAIRVEQNCFPSCRFIQDLGDASVLISESTNYTPSSKARTITPTGGTFSGTFYSEGGMSLLRDRGGSFITADFTNGGSGLDTIRMSSSGLTALTIPQSILDVLEHFEILNASSMASSFDFSSNTALERLTINNAGTMTLTVNSTSGAYPSIVALSLINTTFAPMNLTGFDQTGTLNFTKMKSSGADHTIPETLPNCGNITSQNATIDVNDMVINLDNMPDMANLFGNGGFCSSFSMSTLPHGNISRFQIASGNSAFSQTNTMDFSGESDLSVLSIGGSGTIGPIILPGIGNGENLTQVAVSNLMTASDIDDMIVNLYDIRAESSSTTKTLQCVPASGSLSADSIARIDGTGAYAGDGIVDNNWSVTY